MSAPPTSSGQPSELESQAELLRLDRYVLLERIGRGSFATVWAAYDPQLDRRVAVKLIHDRGSDGSGSTGQRLSNQLAEAQALAQLSHPNVVAVHDVQTFAQREPGEPSTGVFIVMEFLAGASLREWMTQDHGWREVVGVFIDAGRGLLAAHERGLVHRDFKPSNVMFGADERVRVLDFGLASSVVASPERVDDRSSESRSRITGTPAYMAPEQHLGDSVDARSDQFAFCVALYEALYGQRPFAGDDRVSLGRAKLRGEIITAPRAAQVPAWVHAALVRGLAAVPSERFASMDALLDALAHDPGLVRRRWAIAASLAVVIAGSSYGLAQLNASESPSPVACESPEHELEGVWDEAVRANIRRSFAATKLPYADQAFERVAVALDAHTAEWMRLHREVCEATMVRNEQPVEVMAEQMLCLQGRLRRVVGLTTTLEQADAATIARVGDPVMALEPPSTCRSQVADERREQPDAARRSGLLEVEGEVARAGVLTSIGRYDDAIATAKGAIAQALELSDPGGAGRASLAQTRALWYLGRYDEAIAASEQAVRYAAIVGDDETTAMAHIRLIRTYTSTGQYDVAEAIAKLTGGLVEDGRLGRAVEAWYDLFTAMLYGRQRRWDDALAKLDHGLALRKQLYGPDHAELAAFHNTYGNTLYKQGDDLDGALRHYAEALRLWESNFGPEYPDVASVNNNIGAIYVTQSDIAQAQGYFERALSGYELSLGSDNVQQIGPRVNLGHIYKSQGRSRDALAHFERARELAAGKFGEDNPTTALVDVEVAEMLVDVGELERGETIVARVLEFQRRDAPDDLGAMVRSAELLARCQFERGDFGAWKRTLDEALETIAAAEPDSSLGLESLYIEAQLARRKGEKVRALALAEQYVTSLAERGAAGDLGYDIEFRRLGFVVALLLDKGRAAAAATRASEALASTTVHADNRQRWELNYLLGRAEAAKGDHAAALAAFARAQELAAGDDGNPRWAALVEGELERLGAESLD